MEAKRAVFLDKDGTLIPDIPYNVDPQRITLNEGVIEGLVCLQRNFSLIVISNQAGVARGFFAVEALQAVRSRIFTLLEAGGVVLDGFYFCPHHPEGTVEGYNRACECRKPAAGMLRKAAADHNLDLKRSWMIGDILHDVQAGKAAGCRSILINNGNETEWDQSDPQRVPDFIAESFIEAAQYINNQYEQEQYDYIGCQFFQ